MTKPCIIITGANGFIGEQLLNFFLAQGWRVKAFVHSAPVAELERVEYFRYDLEDPLNEAAFEGADHLVHCAYLRYDKNKRADEINVEGAKKIIEICSRKNIKLVFLSSFSAHPAAESHYGKTKLACEKLFDLSKDVVLKPGFVIGKKGLAGELIKTIKGTSLFPLIGSGLQPIQTISIDDLTRIIKTVLEKNTAGLFLVAEPEAHTMKQFYEEIAKQLNKKIRFIPFPLALLYMVCRMSESVGMKLRVSSESVLGLKHLIKFETKADLAKLEITLKNYSESIRSVLK